MKAAEGGGSQPSQTVDYARNVKNTQLSIGHFFSSKLISSGRISKDRECHVLLIFFASLPFQSRGFWPRTLPPPGSQPRFQG